MAGTPVTAGPVDGSALTDSVLVPAFGWRVQIGQFKTHEEAARLKEKARRNLNRSDIDVIFKAPWYRVQVGNYRHEADAREWAEKLRNRGYTHPQSQGPGVSATGAEMIGKSVPVHLLLAALFQAACSPPRMGPPPMPPPVATTVDSATVVANSSYSDKAATRVARWHLLRAQEAQACSLFEQAQQDLDRALRILTANEAGEGVNEATQAELDNLGQAVERTYLTLLPNLKRFSPDSPLTLLLEGVSKEVIEDLPPDAAPFVRIHKLSGHCDIPIDSNAKVAASIHFFQTRGKETFAAWMKRSGRYRHLILEALRAEGLPEDLFHLAMIESGFNPRARSRAHAVGIWQFMESTGRLEGLRQTHWVDERRDPLKSTRAAARHLKGLHRHFRDWRLAIAAYNAGGGRVSRAVVRAGTRDFWSLNLPRETRNYVPLFMAATIISKDPELFGFSQIEADPPLSYEWVELSRPIMLETAAKCMRTSVGALRYLNPELRRANYPSTLHKILSP